MTHPDRFLLAGVMGDPVMHSRSPALHGYWLAKYGLAGAYLPLAIKPNGLRAALRALPMARRRNALRTWIAGRGVEVPTTAQMVEIASGLLGARPDAQPEIRWQGAVMRRRGGRLVLEVKSEDSVEAAMDLLSKSWLWKDHRQCILNQAGDALELIDDAHGAIDLDRLATVLQVRARAGGETIRPGTKARTQSLKKLIQAARLTVEERARLPLVFSGDGLIAAGDRWIDASVAANVKSRRRARLVWTRK